MARILSNVSLVPKIHEIVVHAPLVAKKARPGHFVLVMADERGERIPLTIADFDAAHGTITLVVMVVGTSSAKVCSLGPGDELYAFAGPLGHESELREFGTVVMVAGGVGAAPIYPIARALHGMGNRVVTIQGARSGNLLFWREKLAAVSTEHTIVTDDGSEGRKGLVTDVLREVLNNNSAAIGCVYAIGPAVMMKYCSATTQPFNVRTIVSLNSIMVDGTGMCGGCRVDVAGKIKFTCVDGPEFDGHEVDWDGLMSRQKVYHEHERCSMDRYLAEVAK